jgi:hypothetical protein
MKLKKESTASHAATSSRRCENFTPSKKEPFLEFTETFVIKTKLAKICKSPKFMQELQKLVAWVSRTVYIGSLFANNFMLDQIENGQECSEISHSSRYNLFAAFSGQANNASTQIKACVRKFGELVQLQYSSYKSIGHQTPFPRWQKKL